MWPFFYLFVNTKFHFHKAEWELQLVCKILCYLSLPFIFNFFWLLYMYLVVCIVVTLKCHVTFRQ
jgi:hypothetical protein